MILNEREYRSKVLGCWLGKNIGGTLGAPMEWFRQVNDVTFYTQELGGEPLPNDDLDIQLLWLITLEQRGVDVSAHTLADYWLMYVTPHWAEYGTAKGNLRAGLVPPLSGTYGNVFKDSCGAFIRSEIWACIAPGNPQRAARYALEDAMIDHGDGEGTHAAIFCAALESAAFVESDIPTLIDIALTYIPEDCGVTGAVRLAQECYAQQKSWREARDLVLEKFRGSAYFHHPSHVAPYDREKGFVEGKLGWDVPSNIGMLIIGLLYGEGDFAKSICTAVNCGEDTDCTGATVGALFGILHGAESIPEEWIAPIGRGIKTITLDLGDLGGVPADVDNLSERTERLARAVITRFKLPVQITEQPTDLSGLTADALKAGALREELHRAMRGPVYRFDRFTVAVDYGEDGPFLRNGEPKGLHLHITNTYHLQSFVSLRWYTPGEGFWEISPGASGSLQVLPGHLGGPVDVAFTITAEEVTGPLQRAVVELTVPGWPQAMLVPITLLNGSLQG